MRPDWDEYFLSLVKMVATRSTCRRRQVGALLVKDKRIIASGYNGAPSGMAHCLDIGCLRDQLAIPSGERQELCRGLHAEMNVVIQAAIYGISTKGSTLYCTNYPCILCAKILIQAGIKRIVYIADYPDQEAKTLLEKAGIKVEQAFKERN
ncbi:MAG: cytidine deaminase [Candidatus Omnitrophota bacterium]|nr:MAG: cytidine deaminase [Candidatus Omnitrophota bacterium]